MPGAGVHRLEGEQAGRRPVVIVSGKEYDDSVTKLVLAVPVTTTVCGWPKHIPLACNPGMSIHAMTEQVRPISRDRLERRGGTISPECLPSIRAWIHDYLI